MKRRKRLTRDCLLMFLLFTGWTLGSPVKAADAVQGFVSDQGQRGGRLVFPDERPPWMEVLRRNAEKGDAKSQSSWGILLYSDNKREAATWLKAAADQGVPEAQWFVGGMYLNGEIVARDYQTAYFWFLLATSRGFTLAMRDLDETELRLTPEQRAAAQAAARDWKPKTAPTSAPQDPKASAPVFTAGTGFRVAPDHFITNHHVVASCQQLRVNGVSGQVSAVDARADLALLTAPVRGPIAPLRTQRPLVGEPVAVAGFPLPGLLSGFQVTTGTLASLSGFGGDTARFQISAPVQPGNSGGPVVDAAGRVMGVVVSRLTAINSDRLNTDIPQNVNFAIGGNALRAFLDANGIDYQRSEADRPLPTTTVAQQAQGFTVRVECRSQ